ncbi:hypothetical protein [Streptomyces sp. NPDC004533]|uniref:hypothetical protein n=1 Tax=Streptomyces sp. NPDC004533 TaxID=3154278 RepID=UPI0033B84B0D
MIALHGLWWPDEISAPATVVPSPVHLDEDEIGEALALIEAVTRDDLTGPEFIDRYTEALHAVIEAKQEDRRSPEVPESAARPDQLVDLMAALQESVAKARAARGETGDADPQEAPATPAKKAVARKTVRKAHTQASSSQNAGRADDQRGTQAR